MKTLLVLGPVFVVGFVLMMIFGRFMRRTP
jgi:ABC-type molybdate transport system permease subunit